MQKYGIMKVFANSAQSDWSGTDAYGVVSGDGECPVVVENENDEFENYMLGHIAAGPTGAALAAATETPEITLLMAMNFTDLKAPCKKEIILLQGNSEVTRENYAKAISFSQKVLATIQEITNKSLDANASPNAHSK